MEEFVEEDYSQEKVKLSTWKIIFKAVLVSKTPLIIMMVTVMLLAGLDVAYPLFNKYAIDHYFKPELGPDRFSSLPIFIILYIIIAVLYAVIIFAFLLFAGKVEAETSYQLRKKAYENLQKLPFSYFDKTPSGWIMARMTSDSRKLSNIISWGIVDVLWGILSMIFILVALFIFEWRLALILAGIAPILGLIAYVIRKKILVAYRDVRKENSKITAAYNEGFMGSKTTKSLVIEESNSQDFHRLSKTLRQKSIRAVIFSSMFGPAIWLVGYYGMATTLYTGGFMVAGEIIKLGTLYIFVEYTLRFLDPVTNIANMLAEFQQAQASAERIVSLITTVPEILDTPEVIEKYGTTFEPKKENWESLQGDIKFNNVTFRYNFGEAVLKNFNLHIKQGQSVALVGHTGGGKSTIVNLICRFYEPTEGDILIDDRNYKERSVGWLHHNLGYVLQSPQLFSGTIKENIRYGKLDATDEEIIQAAKTVNAHEFISSLEHGYDTLVGESGNKLSLGEKQLISFARAIVADPKILILDEATSSIDTETEKVIQDTIKIVLKGRTSFMIAHRLSTVVDADLILVLKGGEVIEKGTHSELLEFRGYYFDLYKNQFLKEVEQQSIL